MVDEGANKGKELKVMEYFWFDFMVKQTTIWWCNWRSCTNVMPEDKERKFLENSQGNCLGLKFFWMVLEAEWTEKEFS